MQFVSLGWQRQMGSGGGGGTLPWDVDTGSIFFEDMTSPETQVDQALDALNLEGTRTGIAYRSKDGQRWYQVEQNKLGVMPGSPGRYGLFVGSAVTNRILRSNDLTQWGAPVDASVVYTASGGFAGNGYSTVTFTGANGYVPQVVTDTSAERIAGIWCERVSGSDAVEISQDGGSTYATVDFSAGGIVLRRTAAQTLANPEIRIRGQSGNVVRVYNVNAQRGTVLEDPIITGASMVTRNAESCVKTLAEAPASITQVIDLNVPAVSLNTPFTYSGTAGNLIYAEATGSAFSFRRSIASAFAQLTNLSGTGDAEYEMVISASEWKARKDGGSYVTGAAGIPVVTSLYLGSNQSAGRQWEKPIYRITGIPT